MGKGRVSEKEWKQQILYSFICPSIILEREVREAIDLQSGRDREEGIEDYNLMKIHYKIFGEKSLRGSCVERV